jgi:hypothetical protein
MAIAHEDDSIVRPQWSVLEEQSLTGVTLSDIVVIDFGKKDASEQKEVGVRRQGSGNEG